MSSPVPPKPAHSKKKIPLYQLWLRQNPEINNYIDQREWFSFFQLIIKSLKESQHDQIYQFLDYYLPRLFKNRVPRQMLVDGMTNLRALLLKYFITDPQIPSAKKDELTSATLTIFDNVLRIIEEKYLLHNDLKPDALSFLDEKKLNQLSTMAFFITENRFEGNCHLNSAFQQWTGINIDDFLVKPDWQSLIHPDDYLDFQVNLKNVIENQRPFYELNYRLKNDEGLWEHVTELGKIKYKNITQVASFSGIITEASIHSKYLIQDFELIKIFKYVLEDHKDLAFVVHKNGRLIHMTNALLQFLDSVSRKSNGERFYELFDKENKIIAEKFWESISSGSNTSKNLLIKLADTVNRQQKIIEFSSFSIENSFNRPLYILWGKEIPKRTGSELFLEQSQELLLSAKEVNQGADIDGFHKKVLEVALRLIPNAQFAVFLLKSESGYHYHLGIGVGNDQWREAIRFDRLALEKLKSLEAISQLKREALILESQEFKEILKTSLSLSQYRLLEACEKINNITHLLMGMVKNGDENYGNLVLGTFDENKMFGKADRHLLMMLIQQTSLSLGNIFLRRQLQQKVPDDDELLNTKLIQSQKMASIGSLTVGIAHDFNNILAAIIPGAQLIMRKPQDPKTRERAKIILYMAQRANEISQQLLSYSAKDPGKSQSLNVNRLIEDIKEMLLNIVAPEVSIEYRLASGLPEISIDRNQLLQVLINLVVNAKEAIPGSGKIHISTKEILIQLTGGVFQGFHPGKYVQLNVRDSGTGIPENIRDKIFLSFFTTKNRGKGSGLGLTIVQGIVKKHGGQVIFNTVENNGSVFKVFLPVTPVTRPRKHKPAIRKAPHELLRGEGTILVVDDEQHLREVFSSMIGLMGYRCLEASSGAEALQIYKSNRQKIDLVILDYAMPGLNGAQTYDALKAFNPNIRVILCTGYASQKEVTRMLQQHQIELLAKPFTLESLSKTIHLALERPLPTSTPSSTSRGK